jgi:putative heme transporter
MAYAEDLNAPVKFEPTWVGLTRLAVAAFLIFSLIRLMPLLGMLCLSVLLGVTFQTIVEKLESWGVKRWVGITLLMATMTGMLAAVVFVLVPATISQAQAIAESLPKIRDQIQSHLPNGKFGERIARSIEHPEIMVESLGSSILAMGSSVFYGATSLIVTIIIGFYFVIEGGITFRWLITFFDDGTQAKINRTAKEAKTIVSAYVIGQIITSLLFAAFSGTVLWAVGVPAYYIVAVLAAILDVVPILGITITLVLACLLTMTVSATAAIWVGIAFLVYHGIENYLLIPLIYGTRMRLSNLAVILALAVGAELGGVIGVLLALPIAAAYPVIERIWLKKYLGKEVVEEHRAIEAESSH